MGTRGYSEFPAYGRFLLRLAYGTLRGSLLPPPFTGPSSGWNRLSDTSTGQASAAVQNLSIWRPPTFWLNSRGSPVTATSRSRGWHPLYRRYGANFPNSLAWIFADTPWPSHP